MDIALATYSALPELDRNDQLLIPALARVGLTAAPVRWDDPQFDWSVPKLTVIRSTWDYHRRLPEYLKWIDHVHQVGRIANPGPVVRWNSHKGYLRELGAAGVSVLHTEWLPHRGTADLRATLDRAGWDRAVVKSAVSAGALDVFVVERSSVSSHQARLEGLLAKSDVLVQPFLPHLDEHGEISAVFFEGELTYAIHRPAGIKAPGTMPPETRLVELTPEHRRLAEQTFRALPRDLLYARVDMARDERDDLTVMEVELIEPALYFGLRPSAADRMALAIARAVGPR